ncbi:MULTISPECIES: 3'-5' exonuclease family protein [Giesbergeria]|uniref:Predicted 3'-5' exonuclease PolB-like domain-containing protein n=1 Tax=Giesbergeria sinuosa TaxID=80883 RepID=A0ABV9QBS3_9BURK
MNLFIDIETVPSQHPDALATVALNIRPPGTLKKAESIAAWWANEADQATQEAWRKQALDGGTQGEIISIACTDGDGRDWVACRAQGGDTEAVLLQSFIDMVEGWTQAEAVQVAGRASAFPVDDHFPVAHNAAFDLGFLWRRCVVHGVRIPKWLRGPMARAGWDYGDTMQVWAGYGKFIGLDALCSALGLPSPKADGMDGSQVFDRWLAGDCDAIARYNLQDAQAVAAVWHRLQLVGAV